MADLITVYFLYELIAGPNVNGPSHRGGPVLYVPTYIVLRMFVFLGYH